MHITIKFLLGVIVALVLYGVVGGLDVVLLLASFFVFRLWILWGEFREREIGADGWSILKEECLEDLREMDSSVREQLFSELAIDADCSDEAVAEAYVAHSKENYQPPRKKRDLLGEVAGMVTFIVLAPFVLALFSIDFVSVNLPLTWPAFILVLICFLAYLVPVIIWKDSVKFARTRCAWWCGPLLPLLLAALIGVKVAHPYLNPWHPERERIAAERVLGMDSIIQSGRHAGVVKRYGVQLEKQGEFLKALEVYREALRLNPGDKDLQARVRLAWSPDGTSEAEYRQRTFEGPIKTITLGPDLAELDEFTVVIVSVGAVSNSIRLKVAEVIRRELYVNAVLADAEVPLPEHSRVRGLATGKQWEAKAIAGAFGKSFQQLPSAPVRYLLLTPADTYIPDSNYLFSGSWPWGAFVSLARFDGEGATLEDRAAKQSLCAMIKVFPIEPSIDRDCVTSYCRSVEEFDQKGDLPSEAILEQFHAYVDVFEKQWRQRQTVPQTTVDYDL